MLEINNLVVAYGGIQALKGINLSVEQGKIVALIGANGAGKSTTLKSIVGLVKPVSGSIVYEGKDLLKVSTKDMVRHGLTLVPEGRKIFPDLTVLENLNIGAFCRSDTKDINRDRDWVYELFPILKERNWQLAGTLSGGEQQMLAVGRALMSRPRLLMMDEPSLGLAPLIVKNIFSIIREIHEQQGVTILLIEQNANVSLKIADKGYVIETGMIKLEGTGQELLVNEEVKKAYLGEAH
ncbi:MULTISPECIES: ABC transporter ATP-binding protein [Anoxynatronum]|uniref:Amino acid/amide ABC transporter ATP-binding protein 2, HAAT family n=2 Tax=Anoxynatronum TaxID=210622 RepID=A0AA45WXI9_9CLOT|nr:ABC transporter ATP-binding protein [Anoxynatronum buryatiense]SMP64866.1 amino acid/amide ABC transporter ATP-binding protein 2, HAAT family [Anoxynatronum buryatiense]